MLCPSSIVFVCSRLASAERNENRKSCSGGIGGRPSGMCGTWGGSEICKVCIVQVCDCVSVESCSRFHAPALVYDKGGGSLRAFRRAGLEQTYGNSDSLCATASRDDNLSSHVGLTGARDTQALRFSLRERFLRRERKVARRPRGGCKEAARRLQGGRLEAA